MIFTIKKYGGDAMPESIYEKKPRLKHFDSFVPESLEYPAISVSDFVEASVRDFPESPAIYHGKRKITFSEFGDYVTRFAAALADLGVGKGDRVGILCLNMPQYLIAFYGALKIGAVPTGINPLFTPRELKYILNDSDAETIVALDLFLPRVQEIKEETSLRNVIVTGLGDFPQEGPLPTPQEVEGATQFLDMLKHEPKPPEVEISSKEDWALLQYTAGTTGLPKGTILTHANTVANTTQLEKWVRLERGKEVVCSSFPFFHLAGLEFNILCVAVAAAQILIANPRDIETTFNLIDEYHPLSPVQRSNHLHYAPETPKVPRISHKKGENVHKRSRPVRPRNHKRVQQQNRGGGARSLGNDRSQPGTHSKPARRSEKGGLSGHPPAGHHGQGGGPGNRGRGASGW